MNEKHRLAAIERGVVIAKLTDAFVLSIAGLIDEAIASGHQTDKSGSRVPYGRTHNY